MALDAAIVLHSRRSRSIRRLISPIFVVFSRTKSATELRILVREHFVVALAFEVSRTLDSFNLVSLSAHLKSALISCADHIPIILVADEITDTACASQARVALRTIRWLVCMVAQVCSCGNDTRCH